MTSLKSGPRVVKSTTAGRTLFRVHEGREPMGGTRNPSDGGGFETRIEAQNLIDRVQVRRAAKRRQE